MGEEYYNYFPISETPDTVEGVTMAPFVVAENRDTGDNTTTGDEGQWNDFWGPYIEDPEQPGNFWDSLVSAFDAGAGRALANIKKAITPAQAAAAGRPSAGSSGGGSPSSTKPNQTTTTTTNTTNNVLTSPVAVLAMIFGGLYLLKLSRK